MRLRSGRTILPINATTPPQSQVETSTEPSLTNITEIGKDKEKIDQQRPEELRVTLPPFPERLNLPRPIITPDFDILAELRNLCIKIPLLQAIQDIPIYAKAIKELCGNFFFRKQWLHPPFMW